MDKTVILNLRNLKADLTDEQITANIRGLFRPALLVDIRVVDTDADDAALTTARQAAAQDAYEQAMIALCFHCKDELPVTFNDDTTSVQYGWWHLDGERTVPCIAWKIRALAAAENGDTDNGKTN